MKNQTFTVDRGQLDDHKYIFFISNLPKLPEKEKDKHRDFCVNVCWCVFCVIQNINKNSLSSPIIEYM